MCTRDDAGAVAYWVLLAQADGGPASDGGLGYVAYSSTYPVSGAQTVDTQVTFPLGAAHAFELSYLFKLSFLPSPGFTADQQKLANAMKDYWTSFADNGHPNAHHEPHWPKFDSQKDQVLSLAPANVAVEDDFAAVQRIEGPTLLALTRQAVPILNDIDPKLRREGVLRGGYVAKKEKGELDLIIMSCGSELQHALAAAKQLGDGVRVVSLPCFERFDRQPSEYREEVLPDECRKRVAIEAGVTEIWYQYVGLDGKVIGLHQFGLSAPGAEVMKERGIDAQHVIDAAKSL